MSLLSSHRSSDSGLTVNLHPLVLLTISDCITRHTLRRQTQPIVGGLLGLQSGRSVSLEHAFEVQVIENEDGSPQIHDEYCKDRLASYKAVHAVPQLELVGWFTTAPPSGPEAVHGQLHEYILQTHNETAVLLTFHPSGVLEGATAGGKLPLTIYESLYEKVGEGEDEMDTGEKEARLELRFRELPYSIETGEAEMIGVDSIARGGGNATAVDGAVKTENKAQASQTASGQVNEKGAPTKRDAETPKDSELLSSEDEELIVYLTARANAVKMLHSRIQLIKSYLESLPPSHLTTATDTPDAAASQVDSQRPAPEIDHPLLRSIQALLSRLPLLLPANDLSSFHQETLAEKSDVGLASLLGCVGQGVGDARELGRKFAIIEQGKSSQKRGMFSQHMENGFEEGHTQDAIRESMF